MSNVPATIPGDSFPEHVHIGAGPFGLGMVVDVCQRRAGLKTAVLSRYSGKEYQDLLKAQSKYSIRYEDDPRRHSTLNVHVRYYAGDHDADTLELLSRPSVALITTSVGKENLKEIGHLLARSFENRRQRGASGPLCVMACENLQRNSTELQNHVQSNLTTDLQNHLHKEVFFCDTLVDRICAQLTWRNGTVEVPAESYHDWIVQRPKVPIPILQKLAKKNLVRIAESDIEMEVHEVQKYWCMNAVHLATAAFAYNLEPGLLYFSQALEIGCISKKVKALQKELATAFIIYARRHGLRKQFSEASVREYSKRVFNRIRQNGTDTIARVLKLERGANGVFEILDRLERLILPQCELLAFEKRIIKYQYQNVALQPSLSSVGAARRLQLDDALQQVIIALRHFALKTCSPPKNN
jgi:mannitol-1-phosphate/altronate dehydrogenase